MNDLEVLWSQWHGYVLMFCRHLTTKLKTNLHLYSSVNIFWSKCFTTILGLFPFSALSRGVLFVSFLSVFVSVTLDLGILVGILSLAHDPAPDGQVHDPLGTACMQREPLLCFMDGWTVCYSISAVYEFLNKHKDTSTVVDEDMKTVLWYKQIDVNREFCFRCV